MSEALLWSTTPSNLFQDGAVVTPMVTTEDSRHAHLIRLSNPKESRHSWALHRPPNARSTPLGKGASEAILDIPIHAPGKTAQHQPWSLPGNKHKKCETECTKGCNRALGGDRPQEESGANALDL